MTTSHVTPPSSSQQAQTGLVLRGVGGLYTVACPDGQMRTCTPRGRFRNDGDTPLAGDRVLILPAEGGQLWRIDQLLPRHNQFIRPPMANMDRAILVFAVSDPKPDVQLLDCMLLQAQMANCQITLVLNKADMADDPATPEAADILAKMQHAYAAFDPIAVSARTGQGCDGFLARLAGSTCFVCGQSGAGKSSLLNQVLGVQLQTGELSARISRGRNTTRHVELLPLPGGGWIADTPGFSLLDPPFMPPEELAAYYPEFAAAGPCRFDNCLHNQEPGCAVRQGVAQGAIPRGRYQRYRNLLQQLQQAWQARYDKKPTEL